jgi:hypothetical protein
MGVYQIRNTISDKLWIDSSINVPAKFNRYRLQLNAGSHPSRTLQADWKEFGEGSFEFELLEPLEPRSDPGYDYAADLEVLEDLWLEKLKPYGARGYNEPKKTRDERLRMIAAKRKL